MDPPLTSPELASLLDGVIHAMWFPTSWTVLVAYVVLSIHANSHMSMVCWCLSCTMHSCIHAWLHATVTANLLQEERKTCRRHAVITHACMWCWRHCYSSIILNTCQPLLPCPAPVQNLVLGVTNDSMCMWEDEVYNSALLNCTWPCVVLTVTVLVLHGSHYAVI
jgi:hypothetical protein